MLINITVSNVSLHRHPSYPTLFFKSFFSLGSIANKNCFHQFRKSWLLPMGKRMAWSCVTCEGLISPSKWCLEGILAGGTTNIGTGVTVDPGEPCEVLRWGRIYEATVCPENRAKTELQLLGADKQVNTTQASSNPSAPYCYPSGTRDNWRRGHGSARKTNEALLIPTGKLQPIVQWLIQTQQKRDPESKGVRSGVTGSSDHIFALEVIWVCFFQIWVS